MLNKDVKQPSWLSGKLTDLQPKFDKGSFCSLSATLISSTGSRHLEVWHDGVLKDFGGEKLLIGDPLKIYARDPATGEQVLVFDEAKHGYNSMFCDEINTDESAQKELVKADIDASELRVVVGYAIDYDDERDQYDFDDDGNVLLITGASMSWDQVKTDGIDWFGMSYINKAGVEIQLADFELA